MRKSLLWATLSLSFVFGETVDNLKLRDAIDIVKHSNIELKNMDLDIRMSEKDTDIVKGKNYGKLDFEQQYLRSNVPNNVFGFKLSAGDISFGDFGFGTFMNMQGMYMMDDGQITPDEMAEMLALKPEEINSPEARNLSQTVLKYELPIYTGGMLSNYEKITKKVSEIKKLQREDLLHEKIFELKKSFYSYRLLAETEEDLISVLTNMKALDTVVKEMEKSGYAKKVDILEIKARKGNIENFLNEIKANERLLLHYIGFLTNKHVKSIALPTVTNPPATGWALEDISMVKMAEIGTDINRKMLLVERAAFLPQVGAFAQLSSADRNFMGNLNDNQYTVGVALKMNIFNGNADKRAYEKRRLEILKSENNLELAKKGTLLRVKKLRTEIESLTSKSDSQEKQVELLKEIEENYKARYKEHLVSINEVLIKNSILLKGIMELNKIRTDRQIKILELNKIIHKDIQ